MIDVSGDLSSILDDCGGIVDTVNGDLLGRFVEEPIEVSTSSGHTVLSSEPVFYADIVAINAINLVKDSWLEIDSKRWYIKEIPRADTSGLVRMLLKQ